MTGLFTVSIIQSPEYATVKVKTAEKTITYQVKDYSIEKLMEALTR